MEKPQRVIKFNQNARTQEKKTKKDFEKDFLKFMNNAVFGKAMENVSKHSDKKLLTTERRRIYLVSEPKHNFPKFFTEYLLTIEMKKRRYL